MNSFIKTTRLVAENGLYEPQSTTGGGGIANAFDVVQIINNADAPVTPSATKNVMVEFIGLTAPHTATMPAAPSAGQHFVFVDGDGSLSNFPFTIAGNGKTINGLASFILNAGTIGASPGGGVGPRGSLVLEYDGSQYLVVS